MKNHKEVMNYMGSIFANGALVVVEQSQLDQTLNRILLILGIISAFMSIVYTVFKWYKKVTDVNSDGGTSITIDELKDGIATVKEELKNVDKNK